MKILLISFYNNEAYGLRILKSILTNIGHEVHMLFVNKFHPPKFVEIIHKINPEVVGVSLVSQNFQLYKKYYPHLRGAGTFKIILGGWHPTLSPDYCSHYADIICIGEGDVAIGEILDDLKNDITKSLYTNSLTQNLNYPIFDFHHKNTYVIEEVHDEIIQISYREPYFENKRYGTMIGRGCPYSCTYCSNSCMKNIYSNWRTIRYREINHIIRELKMVKENLKGVERINFYDEVFLPKKEWIDDFCTKYVQYISLPFYCMFYPGTCPEETAKKLKEAGLTGVWLGIQSGSERVRREIFKRYYSNETILKQVEIFKKHNISVKYDFIFDNPFETDEDREETIKLMSNLGHPLSVNMFSLKYFPNTEITQMALKKGYIKDTIDNIYEEKPNYLINDQRQLDILNKVAGEVLKNK